MPVLPHCPHHRTKVITAPMAMNHVTSVKTTPIFPYNLLSETKEFGRVPKEGFQYLDVCELTASGDGRSKAYWESGERH